MAGRLFFIFVTAIRGENPNDPHSIGASDYSSHRARSLLQLDSARISPVSRSRAQQGFPIAQSFVNLESVSDTPDDANYDDLGEYIKKKLLPSAEETRSEMQSELNRAVNMVTACNSQAWGVEAAMEHRRKILDSDEGAMFAAVAEEHRLHLEMNHSCGLVTDWMNGVQPPGRVDELEPKTAGGMLTLLHENLAWFTKETPVFTERATKCDADIRAVAKLHGEVELDQDVANKYHCRMKAARDGVCANYDVCYKEKLHVYQQKKITVADLHKKNVEHFKKLSCAKYVDETGVIQNKECNVDAVVASHLDVHYPSDPMPIECPPLVKTRVDYSDVVCAPDGSVITTTTTTTTTAAPEPVDDFTSTATAKPPPTTKATADDVSVAIVTTKVEGVNYTKLDENQRKTLQEDLASEFAAANGLDASRVEILLTAGSVEVQATIKSTSADSFKVKAPKPSSVVASVKNVPGVENAMEDGREIKATVPKATVFAAQSTTGTATECESVDVPVPSPTPSPTAPPTPSPTAAETTVSNSTANSTDSKTENSEEVAAETTTTTAASAAASTNATTTTAASAAASTNATTTTAAPATESGNDGETTSNASSTASTESGSTSTDNATASSSGNGTSTGDATGNSGDATASSSDAAATDASGSSGDTTASSGDATATDASGSSGDTTASSSDATATDAGGSTSDTTASSSDATATDAAASGTSSDATSGTSSSDATTDSTGTTATL